MLCEKCKKKKKCTYVDLSNFDSRIEGCTFTLACDVNNPLLGECGASYVFGPQKGAKDVEELDQILSHVSNLLEKETGNSCRNNEGAGAAGGCGGADACQLWRQYGSACGRCGNCGCTL